MNIRRGGGAAERLARVVATLEKFDADVLVVTEFRVGANGKFLVDALISSGYEVTHPDVTPSANAVLIASRSPILSARPMGESMADRRHLWAADLGWTTLGGVYMPNLKAKLPYWDALITEAAAGVSRQLLIGDFNTGDNLLDRDPKGVRYEGADRIPLLLRAGFTDAWRTRHPAIREYSWFSNSGNGFRLDQTYLQSRLETMVVSCEYDHTPRLDGVTDHSAMILGLAV